jgi:signal transduction histidine kinase/PAS domain-containing protein/ActR/RegA family two-component response regulator
VANPVLWMDEHGRYLDANDAALDFLECSRDELRQKSIYDFAPPGMVETIRQQYPPLWQTGGAVRTEYQVHGVAKFLDLLIVPVSTSDSGKILTIGRDVTTQQQMEMALHTSAEFVRAIPSGLFIYQYQPPDRLILLEGNPAAETLTGIRVAEWRGREFNEIWPEARQQGITDHCLRVLTTGQTYETENLLYEDERLTGYFRLRAFVLSGQRLGVTFENMTEMKKVAEAEQEQRQLAAALVQTAEALSQSLNFETVIEIILSVIQNLVPHQGANFMLIDPVQESFQIVRHCPCYVRNGLSTPRLNWERPLSELPHLQQMVASGQPILVRDTFTYPSWQPEKHSAFIRSYIGLPVIVEGQVIGVLNLDSNLPDFFTKKHVQSLQAFVHQAATAIRNAQLHRSVQEQLTQLRQAQTRLIQSEKLAAIGELVAGVAHELNNPLSSVILYSQLIQQRPDNAKIHEDVAQIVTQSHRAAIIVRSLLDFARQRPPEQSPTQVNNVLRSTLDLLAYELRTHNVTVLPTLDAALPLVMADAHQLQQVFLNLITNALQAMRGMGKGRLWLETAVVHSDTHTTPTDDALPVVRIIIRDDGPGIPADLQRRIFDPFFTTKIVGEGTGLGLSVCHGIISEHQGSVWVESQMGQGAAFFIELPISQSDIRAAYVSDDDEAHLAGAPRASVLVIDDEESILEALPRVLQQYHVQGVTNTAAALEELALHEYDLIICDVHMPGGSGLKFHRQLSAQFPHLARRIIFMTGDTVSTHTRDYMTHAGVMMLSKPFDIETLFGAVRKVLADGRFQK